MQHSGDMFQAGIFLDFVWLTARMMHPMGRACGEPDGIELLPMGVILNGSHRGVDEELHRRRHRVACDGLLKTTGGNIFRVGISLGFVRRSGTARAEGPHGVYVRGAERDRIDPHRGEFERLGTRTV